MNIVPTNEQIAKKGEDEKIKLREQKKRGFVGRRSMFFQWHFDGARTYVRIFREWVIWAVNGIT